MCVCDLILCVDCVMCGVDEKCMFCCILCMCM